MPHRFLIGFLSSLDPRTLRGRVTLVLNGTMVILLVLFLLIDCQRDFADRLELKRTALNEQARLIEPGVVNHWALGADSLREFLRATRDRMEDVHHGEHWLAVHTLQGWVTTGIPDRISVSIHSSLDKVARGKQTLQQAFEGDFLVGQYAGTKVKICVAETYQEVRAAIWSDLRRHIFGVGAILLVGIVTLNLVMRVGFIAPLTRFAIAARAVGQGHFGTKITRNGMRELDDLATAFNGMSDQLAEVERTRAAQLHTARLIQEHLMPKSVSIIDCEVAHFFKPTEEIGGDYYDFLPLKDGSSLIAIADASGHGVPAALVAAIVKVLLLDAADRFTEPAEIIRFIDQRMTSLEIPEAFITMQIVRIQPGAAFVDYASAGHISGWVVESDSVCHAMPSTGPILGAGIDVGWQAGRIPFKPGSRMALLTDGVIEATGPTGEDFGESRVCDVLKQTISVTAQDSLSAVCQQLHQHMQGREYLDDISLILVDAQAEKLETDL